MKKHWLRLSIYKKLLLALLLLGYLPVVSLTAAGYGMLSKITFKLISYSTLQTLNQERDHLDKLIQGINEVMLKISAYPDVQEILMQKQLDEWERYSQSRSFSEFTQIMKLGHPEIYNITVLGNDGNRMDSFGHVLPFEVVPPPYTRIKQQLDAGQPGESFIYKDHTSRPLVSFGKSMIDVKTGTVIGMVIVDLDLNIIREDLSNVRLLPSSEITLLQNDSEVIYHHGLKAGDKLSADEVYPASNNNFVLKKDKGESYVYLRTSLQEVDWTLYGVVPYEYVTQKVAVIKYYFYGFAVVFLVLMVFLFFSLRKFFVVPIRTLQRLMGKVGTGETYLRANFRRNDEIGDLAMSFNGMIDQIEELIQQVYTVKINESKALLLQREAEMRSLQSQITPHFLYNTLNLISWVASKRGVREIEQIVHSLSIMLRYSLGDTSSYVKLSEEMNYVERYISIMNFRFGGDLKLVMNMPEKVDHLQIPRFTIQPIVENSVKHAFMDNEGDMILQVSIQMENRDLLVQVKDNGCGISNDQLSSLQARIYASYQNDEIVPEENEKSRPQVGLINVHQRLQMMFGEAYGIRIESTLGRGTCVTIKLPVELRSNC